MRKFLFNILIYSLPVALLLFLSDSIVETGLRKTKLNYYKEWNMIYNGNISADFIILGSSRAWKHVSPRVLDSIIGSNSFNLGLDDYDFILQYNRFRIFCNNNELPKTVILCLDLNSLSKRSYLYDYKQYLPYMATDSILKNTLELYDYFSIFDFYLPFYRYFGHKDLIKVGFLEYFNIKHFENQKYKGYSGLDLSWDGKFEEFVRHNPKGRKVSIDELSENLFDDFLSQCKAKKINVILVYTPEFEEAQKYTLNRAEIFCKYQEYAEQYHINFLNYSTSSICFKQDYFYNSQHLNKIGSQLFTDTLANDILNLIRTE